MIALKKGHDIHHLTNYHLFPHSALWQRLAVQDVLMQIDIVHQLSPPEASWPVLARKGLLRPANELINDKAVCTTAPATPGLLNMIKILQSSIHNSIVSGL